MRASVRSARTEDVPTIAQLYLEVADEVVAREPSLRHVPDAAAVERRYHSRLEETDRVVFVAEAGSAVIGFIDASLWTKRDRDTYERPGNYAHIEELIVAGSHRRRGTATALLRTVEWWAGGEGARVVWVDTHVSNDAARALYAASGFEEVGVVLKKEL